MNTPLFDPTKEIPAAPVPESKPTPSAVPASPAIKPKPKRKSYYIPVAERAKLKAEAKKEAKKTKEKEQALREGKDVPAPKTKPAAKPKTSAPKGKKVVMIGKTSDKASQQSSKSTTEAICSVCHKPLSKHTSVANGMGDTCAAKIKLLPKGVSLEDHYEKLTVFTVPDGYIKLRDAVKKLQAKGISGYRIMQAIGGERMLRKPINSNFKVVFVGKVRYINGACLANWKDLVKV